MSSAINQQHSPVRTSKGFQEFIFIGNTSNKSGSKETEQLNLSPDSRLVNQATVEDSLKIIKLHTNRNLSHQLKSLKIKPGIIVKLVNKTNNGSVVVSLGDKLIGIGAEIACKIIATPAT